MQELKRMREQVEQLQSEREQLLKAANNKGKLSGGSKEKCIALFEWNIRRGMNMKYMYIPGIFQEECTWNICIFQEYTKKNASVSLNGIYEEECIGLFEWSIQRGLHTEYTHIPGIYGKECLGLFEWNIRNIAFAVDIGVSAKVKSKGKLSGVCGSNEDCTGLFWENIGWMCLDS